MACLSMENRPLKKLRLGPPDVYPQDPKQKEDELTPVNVKQGFSHTPNLNQSEEYGSAKSQNFSVSKVQTFINGVLTKKQEINMLPDTGRKRQLINPKENFHNVTPKSKMFIESWFKDLAGSKPLINLGKRVPIFNKKEEIFIQLSEYQVPMSRAIWLIKMTSAYSMAISEAKMKKRQVPDSSQEWTSTLVRFLKEQIVKLQDFYQKSVSIGGTPASYASNAAAYHNGSPLMTDEQKLALRQFNYCQQLCKVMFEEGLLECQDFLQWQLDMLEKCKTCDDGLLKFVVPMILQYIEEFTQCEILSRKLVFQVCRRLSPLLSNDQSSEGSISLDVGNCGQHRSVLIQMSAIIQAVVLHCPTALVWNHAGEGKMSSHLVGSPLDQLPLPPSALPMAPRFSNEHVRQMLRDSENIIKQRSKAAESRWPLDKLIPIFEPNGNTKKKHHYGPQTGMVTARVLHALEALDLHSFDRVDSTHSIDSLYSKLFPTIGGTKGSPDHATAEQIDQFAKQDEPYVRLLCQWAVSDQRSGEHRAIAAALLLEKRQSDLVALAEADGAGVDDNDTDESSSAISALLPIYQGFLMKFLDTEAPVLNEPVPGHSNRTVFASLVHLFHELIKHEVFSHDMYMCTLISRGDLQSITPCNNGTTATSSTSGHFAGTPSSGMSSLTGFQSMNDMRCEMDDSKIDDDLGKLLQHIKEEQQIVMDTPDSPKDENHSALEPGRGEKEGKRQSRHLLFTTHFPLPQDDSLTHDCNQRHILLYGVGKAREESRHAVKKVSKEMCRLFHKKLAIDVQTEGTNLAGGVGAFVGSSKSRKHSSRLEFNFELSMQRFLTLSYFDRHAVAAQAVSTCMEMINSFIAGGAAYLPVLEHISFLFDLFEVSLSISGVIDLCLQLLKELPEVELLLSQRNSVLSRSYLTNVGLYIVGVLRRFHCCLLLSPESTASAFESLCRIVKHVTNPADCSSAERCILAYLYDLYSCCSFLKAKNGQMDSSLANSNSSSSRNSGGMALNAGSEVFAFSNAYPKIKQTIFAPVVSLPKSLHPLNRDFLQDYITSPRRKPEPHILRQLSDSAQLRYSFVCNVVVAVCNEVDNDKLNEIALLCAELTAGCSALSAEWLGVLTTLCYSATTYMDVLTQVDVQDNSIHHNLAVLFSVLLARHCFGLQDFLLYVGVPSLVKIWNEGGRSDTDPEAEAGARLTCHLVLRLFKTSDAPHPACYTSSSHSVNASPHHTLQQTASSSSLGVKLACDRHLLAATHNSISVGPVLAVLKAILVLADRVLPEGKGSRATSSSGGMSNSSNRLGGGGNPMANEVSISHILGTSWSGDLDLDMGSGNFGGGGRNNFGGATENVPLASYARYVLRQICSQPWVHQRCLQNPEELLKPDGLLDSCLSLRQAQRLLQMISRPDAGASAAEEQSNNEHQDYRQVVNRVLESLDQWRLRVAWLDLQLLCQQLTTTGSGGSSSTDMNQLLEAIARAVLDVFELFTTSGIKEDPDQGGSTSALKKRNESVATGTTSVSASPVKTQPSLSISLIAPLVSKLPGPVQGRILKVASQVLEICNWGPPSKGKDKERNVPNTSSTFRSKSLLSYEPLLSLVMTCLKGQDEQREAFLSSLHSQLSHFIFLPKEERLYHGEDIKARQAMLEALQLRFSLVGGLFDSILRNPTVAIDWAILLTQLVTAGVVDLTNNTELFATLQDMLATLLHSTLVTDGQSERGEDSRKYYPILIKKLKKELAERKGSPSIQCIKQLLPLPKLASEFVTCEPYGTLTDIKGNKISGFDSNDKKQGHRLHEKQRVSPWEILEGHKTVAPLSWAWFGAVRIERKPLRHQEVQRLLRHHTHALHKPASYYLEHPLLPPEDLEPPVVEKAIPKEEICFKTEPTSDQSPRGGTKRGQKTNQRRPRGRRGAAAAAAAAAAATVAGAQPATGGYQSPVASGMYPPSQPPPQWNAYPPPAPPASQQGTVPTSAAFFPQQAIGPRFPTERPGTQSRQALSNMLRQRHPGTQFVPTPASNPSSGNPIAVPNPPPTAVGGVGSMANNSRIAASVGAGSANQPQFSGISMVDKQRQQQFIRQQMRQQHTGGNVFGQQGPQQSQPQPQQPQQQQQQQQQVQMAPGGFANIHTPMNQNMNQNFNMFQSGTPGMQQLVNPQQQTQPQTTQQQPQQQGMIGQHFNQGGNFPMQQTQPQGNMILMQQQQPQGRGMNTPAMRPPFMQINSVQPNQYVRGAMPNTTQQQAVRLQHQQMVAIQQQQQMQHNMGQQQQHNQHYQSF